MFGAVSPDIDEVQALVNAARAQTPGPGNTRFITRGGTSLGVLLDTTPGSEEGFCSSEDGACAIVSGTIGLDGSLLSGGDAASLLLGCGSTEGTTPARALNGLFVGALWQADQARLVLLGDWIGGLKQLFYAQSRGGFVFGTRAVAVLDCAVHDRQVDRAVLTQYLDFGHCLPPGTLFEGLYKLPAGCELTLRNGDLRIRRSFRLQFSADGADTDSARRLRDTHRDAVGRCLLAGQSVGAFLSGGLDSSLNVAAMSDLGVAPIRTFSIVYPGQKIDESGYARLVADRFDTEHHELALQSAAVLDELPEMVWALEEPAMDCSFIPTFNLARFAREHVGSVISGDGPDHLFGRHYPVALIREALARLPGAQRLAAALVPRGRPSAKAVRLWRAVRCSDAGRLFWKALQSLSCDSLQAYLSIYREIACRGILPERASSLLMEPGQMPEMEEQVHRLVSEIADAEMTEFERITALDLMIDGSCGVFSKVGRMAGYHGLTVHEPYLDSKVRSLVEALPPRLKAAGSLRDLLRGRLRRKVLLYEAARGVLPDEILDKPKQGFQAPIGEWLNEWIHGRDASELLPALTRMTSLLHDRKVNSILHEHAEGVRDHGTLIMMLITLDLWYAIFVLGNATKPDWRWSDWLSSR